MNSGSKPIVRADQVPVGTVARVRFPHKVARQYVAEVRTDFGRPQWFGSWHGFALEPRERLVILSLLTDKEAS